MLVDTVVAQKSCGSGVYVGGHIWRERPNTIKTLRESEFIYVILFNVDDVRLLKTQPTSINRIENCIGGWG